MTDVIHSAAYRTFRAAMKEYWQAINAPCGICFQRTIDWDGRKNAPDSFELHHPKSRKRYPHLALDPLNAVASHTRCNRSAGADDQRLPIGETDEEY